MKLAGGLIVVSVIFLLGLVPSVRAGVCEDNDFFNNITINITNNNDTQSLFEGFSVNLSVNTSSTFGFQGNGTDLRLYFNENQIDRWNSTDFDNNATNTSIWFSIQENISANSSNDTGYMFCYNRTNFTAEPLQTLKDVFYNENNILKFEDVAIFFPFENVSSSVVIDISNNTNNAEFLTESVRVNDSRFGNGVDLSGNNSVEIKIPNNSSWDSFINFFSVVFWVKPRELNGFLVDGRGGASEVGIGINMNTTGDLNPYLKNDNGLLDCNDANVSLQIDRWHHVAYTYRNEVQGIVDLYIDAQLVAHCNGTHGDPYSAAPPQPIILGGRFDSNQDQFNGTIDQFFYFNDTLNQTEIQEMFIFPEPTITFVTNQPTDPVPLAVTGCGGGQSGFVCGGDDANYVLPCNGTGAGIIYNFSNSTFCRAGCTNGTCNVPTVNCINYCDTGQTTCGGGLGGDYVLVCGDDDSNGCREWSIHDRTFCPFGCQFGFCLEFPNGSASGLCSLGQAKCGGHEGKEIIWCDDDNNDTFTEWSGINRTFCKFGCFLELDGSGVGIAQCHEAPQGDIGFRNWIDRRIVDLQGIFPSVQAQAIISLVAMLSLGSIAAMKTNSGKFGLVIMIMLMILFTSVGWFPIYITVTLFLIGGVLLLMSRSRSES